VFETEIVPFEGKEVPLINPNDWQLELADGREVYKLTTRENLSVIQGLISFEEREDHIFINVIESASFNKGKMKLYNSVPGNLVAFVCKASFERGFDGFVVFEAKSQLIGHYENSLGAKRMYGQRMFLDKEAARSLLRSYFKDFYDARL
jgi:hypothetical protein